MSEYEAVREEYERVVRECGRLSRQGSARSIVRRLDLEVRLDRLEEEMRQWEATP